MNSPNLVVFLGDVFDSPRAVGVARMALAQPDWDVFLVSTKEISKKSLALIAATHFPKPVIWFDFGKNGPLSRLNGILRTRSSNSNIVVYSEESCIQDARQSCQRFSHRRLYLVKDSKVTVFESTASFQTQYKDITE